MTRIRCGAVSVFRQGETAVGGFTLIELVVIMTIIGILAVVALPRLMDRTVFDERGFYDSLKAGVQYARKVAVASRRYVCVNVTAGAGPVGKAALLRDATIPESLVAVNCIAAVNMPTPGIQPGCAANEACAPSGVTLGGASVIFDPLGRPVDSSKNVLAAVTPLTVSNQPDITIQPVTGLVR